MKPVTSPWSNAVLGRASLPETQVLDAAPAAPPLTRKRAFWRQEWFLFLLFVPFLIINIRRFRTEA